MRRRVTLVVGIAGLIVLGVAAVALAATFVGNNGPNNITGTANSDRIYGLSGLDNIRGADGGDYIECGAGADNCHGAGGIDKVSGGPGPDDLFGDANNDILISVDGVYGNDTVNGGTGTDTCIFDSLEGAGEDDFLNCEKRLGANLTLP